MPAGLDFVSANGGGVVADGVVQWNLGTVLPGNVGELRATFAVPGSAGYGTLIKVEGLLQSANGQQARADEITQIAEERPLAVTVSVTPDSAQPGAVLGGTLTVTNGNSFERANVVVRMRYPVGMQSLAHGAISDGGTCVVNLIYGGYCDESEILTWNLGTIAANSTRTVTLPPVIATAVQRGSLIPFVAWVEDDTSRSQATDVIGVGTFVPVGAVDEDNDGADDSADNCLGLANPGQQDTNGDGYGNLCDPDLNNDGIVNATDFNLLRAAFFTSGPGLDADFNQDGFVNFGDLAILRKYYGGAPGPSASAN